MMVYNSVDTVGAAIDSVLAQSWPAVSLTLLDNASTDGTMQVMQDYAERYPGIRIRRNRCNVGPVANIQRAFWGGDADFVMPKTGDDLIAPDFIERLMAVLLAFPDCAMCHADGLVFTGVRPGLLPLSARVQLGGDRLRPGGAGTPRDAALHQCAGVLGRLPAQRSRSALDHPLPRRLRSCRIGGVGAVWRNPSRAGAAVLAPWRRQTGAADRARRHRTGQSGRAAGRCPGRAPLAHTADHHSLRTYGGVRHGPLALVSACRADPRGAGDLPCPLVAPDAAGGGSSAEPDCPACCDRSVPPVRSRRLAGAFAARCPARRAGPVAGGRLHLALLEVAASPAKPGS